MLQGEHSEDTLTFIKLPFVIKMFVWSIFEWPFYTSFTVCIPVYRDIVLLPGVHPQMVQCKHEVALEHRLCSSSNSGALTI